MSVDATKVKAALPQEGQELVSTTDITGWETEWTTIIQLRNSNISGTTLDSLLYLKCIELGLMKMGLDPGDYPKAFERLFSAAVASANADLDPSTITDTQVYTVGEIPWMES